MHQQQQSVDRSSLNKKGFGKLNRQSPIQQSKGF